MMDNTAPDPRLHAFRTDLADAALRGKIVAERYADGQNVQVLQTVPMRQSPAANAMMTTQAMQGEMGLVFEVANGWAWVQLHRDGYVGYVPADVLTHSFAFTTHYISSPTALVFPQPDLKTPPVRALYLGTELCLGAPDGAYVTCADGMFVHARTVSPLGKFAEDYVSIAERFAGVTYLWGGKTAAGLDCSGLVQVALQAVGLSCRRDSDMQMATVGQSLGTDPDAVDPQRGDLVFWAGHVGIMTDAETLLHANAYHMEVAREPLAEAVARIGADGNPVLDIRRPADVFSRLI